MLGFLSIYAPLCTVENKGVRACDRAIFQRDRGDRYSTESSGRMRKTDGFVLSWTQWFGRFLINGFLAVFSVLVFWHLFCSEWMTFLKRTLLSLGAPRNLISRLPCQLVGLGSTSVRNVDRPLKSV